MIPHAPAHQPQASPGVPAIVAAFFRYAGGFWMLPGFNRAVLLTLLLAVALLGRLMVDLGVNTWNRWFFDALEAKEPARLVRLAWMFALLVVGVAAVGAAVVHLRETLQVSWRAWLTQRLLNDWLTGQRASTANAALELENAEYRISDDVRMATEPMVDFGIGFFSATITGLSFLGVLWSVGGSITIGGVTIPAYFVIGALCYGLITNTLVPFVGQHLTPVTALRNEAEARFRAVLIRSRQRVEQSEGDLAARRHIRAGLIQSYKGIVVAWTEMVRQHVRLTWLTNSNSVLTPVIPLLLGAPAYLTGQLTMGQIVQLALAFTQVQLAIGWVVDNYMRIAEWRASAVRVLNLAAATGAGVVEPLPEEPAPAIATGAAAMGAGGSAQN